MSAEKCIGQIKLALGRDATEQELYELLEVLMDRQRKLIKSGMGQNKAADQAAEEVSKEMRIAAMVEKRNALLRQKRIADAVSYVRDNWMDDRPDLGVESFLVGTNIDRTGSRMSVAAEQKQLWQGYIGGLINDIKRIGDDAFAMFARGTEDREISGALWELNRDAPDMDGFSAPVVAVARVVRKWQEKARLDANEAGAYIGKRENWIVRQSHDPYKMLSARFDTWRAAIVDKLDWDTMDVPPRLVDTFLRETYDNLVTGKHMVHGPGWQFDLLGGLGPRDAAVRGPSALANRISRHRRLLFKTADGWFDYNKQFGSSSLREALMSGLQHMGEATGLMRKLGPNPEYGYKEFIEQIDILVRQRMSPEEYNVFKGKSKPDGKFENRFRILDGSFRVPVNETHARVASTVMGIQNMSKLGGAVITAVADLGVAASELKYQGMSFLGSFGRMIGGLARGRPDVEKQEILADLSVFFDSMRGDIASRFSAHDSLPGRMSRAQTLFFKINGLTWWTETARGAATLMTAHNLGRKADVAFADLDAETARLFRLYDIGPSDWNAIRGAVRTAEDERAYVSTEGLSPSVAGKLRTLISDRATSAVIEPDARTRAVMLQGTRPGTATGTLFRFIGQFKSFPVAVLQRSVGREIFGRGHKLGKMTDGYTKQLIGALRGGEGGMLGLVQLLVATTALGYLSMATKDLLKGREPRDPADWKTMMAAMLQGGALGIYGDFLLGEASRFGSSPVETVAGPAIGSAGDAVDLVQRAMHGEDLGSSTLRFAVSNTPFANLFYTRMAIDYLFLYALQDAINPGSVRRMQKRIERENNQEFILEPTKAIGVR